MNTVSALKQQLTAVQQAIADILLGSPGPVKEFDLIQQLQQSPYELLSKHALRGELQLFRTHFLVFHCLYKLQALWRTEQSFELYISPLAIKLSPYQPGPFWLAKTDPLQSYYSDWANMNDTSAADVSALLNNFWQGFTGTAVAANEVAPALVVLELEQLPTSTAALRNQYRRLVHIHHPDKGGELKRMQNIQQAYLLLKNYLASCGR